MRRRNDTLNVLREMYACVSVVLHLHKYEVYGVAVFFGHIIIIDTGMAMQIYTRLCILLSKVTIIIILFMGGNDNNYHDE